MARAVSTKSPMTIDERHERPAISSALCPCACAGSAGRTLARKRTTHMTTRTATSSPITAQTPSV